MCIMTSCFTWRPVDTSGVHHGGGRVDAFGLTWHPCSLNSQSGAVLPDKTCQEIFKNVPVLCKKRVSDQQAAKALHRGLSDGGEEPLWWNISYSYTCSPLEGRDWESHPFTGKGLRLKETDPDLIASGFFSHEKKQKEKNLAFFSTLFLKGINSFSPGDSIVNNWYLKRKLKQTVWRQLKQTDSKPFQCKAC